VSEQFKSVLDMLEPGSQNSGELRNLTDEALALTSAIKKIMDQGLTPEAIGPARGLFSACQAAVQILKKFSAS
jgi:hypothetical protein